VCVRLFVYGFVRICKSGKDECQLEGKICSSTSTSHDFSKEAEKGEKEEKNDLPSLVKHDED
jgi:hypothetical protein